MLKYMNFSPLQIVGMLIFVACMLGFIIWATGFRKQQKEIIKHQNKFFIFSGILLVICIGSLLFKGVNWGLDFKGGTVIEIGVDPKITAAQVREGILEFAKKGDIGGKLDAPKVQMEELVKERQAVQPSATETSAPITTEATVPIVTETPAETDTPAPAAPEETTTPGDTGGSAQGITTAQDSSGAIEIKYKKCMIQTKELSSDEVNNLVAFLKTKLGDFEVLKQETVGPIIGQELQKKALIALLLALGAQLLYITFRFGTQFRYGVAADIALLHDIIVMVGLYSLLGRPIDSSFLAALLTIIGYSVMDSVVVFDRIRENLDLMKGNSYEETVNISLNQTMTRTALTSVTTIMTLFALYYFGGSTLNNFAIALLIGAVAGTYSSLFIASPLLVIFDNMAKDREKKRVDDRRRKLQDEAEEKARQRTMPREQIQQKPKEKAATTAIDEESDAEGEGDEEGTDEASRRRRKDRKRRR